MSFPAKAMRGILAWPLGLASVLVLVLVLFSSESYSAGITVTSQPLQNTGAQGTLTHTGTYSSATSTVTRPESSVATINASNQVTGVTVKGTKPSGAANVSVTLKDSAGATVDSGSGALPSAAGAYTTLVTLTGGTIAYITVATILASYTSAAVSIQLTSVADSWVRQDASSSNFGTATTMEVQSRSANRNRRSFGWFDVSSIPAGSTVSSATLRLCATTVPTATRTYDVHRVTAAWVETSITWANQPAVAASATASATTPASAGCMTWTVTADVQAWVSGTANNGWRIVDSVESSTTQRRSVFRTREDPAVPADQPKLDVTYTPP